MNNKQKIIITITFGLTLLIHFIWVSKELEPKTQWADVKVVSENNLGGYTIYFQDGEYFFALSYALLISFTVFALSEMKIDRKKGAAGIFGGITLSALLATFGCFIIGCCGSPMAVVYLSMFGSSYLEFAKPVIFIVTLLSVVYGYKKITQNKNNSCSSCADDSCN